MYVLAAYTKKENERKDSTGATIYDVTAVFFAKENHEKCYICSTATLSFYEFESIASSGYGSAIVAAAFEKIIEKAIVLSSDEMLSRLIAAGLREKIEAAEKENVWCKSNIVNFFYAKRPIFDGPDADDFDGPETVILNIAKNGMGEIWVEKTLMGKSWDADRNRYCWNQKDVTMLAIGDAIRELFDSEKIIF
jgi:hypothetical protein